MSIIPKNDKAGKPKANRRRRKKRRTEDFSDSSDSSSSSSSESEHEEEEEKVNHEGEKNVKQVDDDGDVFLSDHEIKIEDGEDFSKTQNKLKTIQLTKTSINTGSKNINLNQVEKMINDGSKDLENDYLMLMFNNYDEDIDKIRSVPDFSEKSLSILANVLKNGSNIFDHDTLKAVVGK